ncbi:alpha/beta fold hydrolase [Paenibacillus sp. LK1]|uniref:alpha/beta fold hydrolase n=1 Tax=Paenibacillus sp. LK1 TaxID=2053014 RepID=UPI000C1A2317|nr:alpha/beta hydrolase [Paenibacillus sp. LK1]PIH55448.1 alpha/beta hydrolase [Paenibacillus sp. LK1]
MSSIYRSEEGKSSILEEYEAYVEQLGEGFTREYVETRFGQTHVLLSGPEDGKPLFILQGGNCVNPMTLSWFSSLFKDYRIIAPDTIGHPGYSEETRISARFDSLALWISDLLDHYKIEKSAFIGPSFGGGIILRLATYIPDRIACSVLVAPAGLAVGSKIKMAQDIVLPLVTYKMTSSPTSLQKIADIMSCSCMKEIDKNIIGKIFKYVSLEQDMPKLTEQDELVNYTSPTLLLVGEKDVFFPADKVIERAQKIIPNVKAIKYDTGHFPSQDVLKQMNQEIQQFLQKNY